MVYNKYTYIPLAGSGASGAGSSPAGYGNPTDVNYINQDFIIMQGTGMPVALNTLGNSPFIDPVTKDYLMDGYGRFVGADVVQQQVYLAIATAKGSYVNTSFGVSYSSSPTIAPNLQAAIANDVTQALQDLINRKLIVINNISTAQYFNNNIQIKVSWTNISNGINYLTTV